MPSSSPAPDHLPLRRDPDFVRLWLAQTASQLGERSATLILPLIAVGALAASAADVGLLRASLQAPALLLCLLLGALADRWDPRWAMIVPDLVRLGVAVVLVLFWSAGLLQLPVLLAAGFLLGTMSLVFDLGYQLTLVRLVRPDRFGSANSALETARSGTQIAGPATGGGLVSWLTAPWAMVLPAVGWAASAGLSAGIDRDRIARDVPLAPPGDRSPRGLAADLLDGLRLVLRHPLLRSIGWAAASFQFAFAALTTVYLVFLIQTLQLSAGMIGLLLAAYGPGAVVGSVLAGWLPRRIGYGAVMVGAAGLTNVMAFAIPLVHGPVTVPLLITINVVIGACGQLVDVQATTVRQTVTPVASQGRAIATINMMGIGLAPFGSLAGGWLAELWTVRGALLAAAAIMIISPVLIAASPLGRIGRTLPDHPISPSS